MRAVIQRVSHAAVHVGEEIVGRIGQGLVVLLGVGKDDDERDARYVAGKLTSLRIFADERGKMNRAVGEVGGGILLVSQFTLLGDMQKGRRPGFDKAAPPDLAMRLYELVAELTASSGVPVETGRFGAVMRVELVNDGPVTLLLDSRDPPDRRA